ncbi:uncharacterized protein A1O5_01521 [Cladophialophora psammophila CBS 110553]|uniref:Inosine/uridine-preferring nucleoside hydrolase domain-containing protein n=1 Tax=Cladophialophora psammophila CBS 110553 TaxID=1182543 RepID=W9XBV4_9EURO|nr:uncharacterized protein A1O5_01521 [Cladophialophora psammophila CBS 110553]EXJ74825.1 hypothetical protein A1O5_01521 [Cladophialophora psammophila CBS 110553]
MFASKVGQRQRDQHKLQDVFAILIAAHHPKLKFLGVSSTHGNAPQIHTTNNSSAVLNAVGRTDVKVYPGSLKPFCREEVETPDIHGPTGLGGTSLLPQPAENIVKDVNFLVATRDAIMAEPPQTAWYVATGPCTNAALLFSTYPEVARHLAGVSIMGGAVGGDFCPQISKEFGKTLGQGEGFGNETPWAEFNIYCDPEAAEAVFSNPVISAKTTLVTLDLTHQCLATKEIRDRFLGSEKPSQLRLFLHEILAFFAQSYVEWFDVYEGPPLHDPLAIAALFGYSSGIYEDDGDRYNVRVVTDGAHSPLDSVRGQVGRTIVEKAEAGPDGIVKGVRIPRKLHTHAFWDVLENCAKTADERISP